MLTVMCRTFTVTEAKLGEVDQREVCTFVLSPEFLQQRPGLLEIGRV